MKIEDDLKREIESYFPDAEIVATVEFDGGDQLEGFGLVKPKELKETCGKYWHWHIREQDEDLDFCIAKARDQIAHLEFIKPVTKIYWRLNPAIEDIKTFNTTEVIHYITIRFTLAFSKGEADA